MAPGRSRSRNANAAALYPILRKRESASKQSYSDACAINPSGQYQRAGNGPWSVEILKGEAIMSTKAMIGIVFALTAVLASPAFAQTTAPAVSGAYIQPIAAHRSHPNWNVYVNGRYVGTDPDPTIRSQLAHDPCQGGAC
jgi:hypothetical protein